MISIELSVADIYMNKVESALYMLYFITFSVCKGNIKMDSSVQRIFNEWLDSP